MAESAYASRTFAFPLELLARAAVTFAFGRRRQMNVEVLMILRKIIGAEMTFKINIKSLRTMISLQNIKYN